MGKPRMVAPVIMSGGSGTRLWPVSTDERPKQFHALATQMSMLQDTALRFHSQERVQFLDPVVICNVRHGALARDQLAGVGVTPAQVILEPFGRNTAAVAVIAAEAVRRRDPEALVLLLPADHVVADPDAFLQVISRALEPAAENIVTFGIEPTGPETGYGYIQSGPEVAVGVFQVERFVEKPDRETAQRYVETGGYSWNAGIFLYAPKVLLSEAMRFCDDIRQTATAAFDEGEAEGVFVALDADRFVTCPSQPVDIAIMEKTSKAVVAPCDIGWADVGSWSELWRQGPAGENGNVFRGEVLALDSANCLVWSDGPKVALLGVTDMMLIAAGQQVLLLPRHRGQDVKKIVEVLQRKVQG